jgi:hypothetical protein
LRKKIIAAAWYFVNEGNCTTEKINFFHRLAGLTKWPADKQRFARMARLPCPYGVPGEVLSCPGLREHGPLFPEPG